MTNLIPYAIAWAVLAVIVLVLALMRRGITAHEDDSIHLTDGGAAVGEQLVVARKLEGIDKWGKILTVVLVVTGLALAIVYGLQLWDATSKVGLA
jgi:cytochrome b subunit of formate dehydrogenase